MEIVLAEGESIVREEAFNPSLVLFWLKSRLVLTNRRLLGTAPNTVLGLIPLGTTNITQPLKGVSQVAVSSKFRIFRFIIGLLVLIAGFGAGDVGGVVIGLVGLLILVLAFNAQLEIRDNSGSSQGLDVAWNEKAKAESFAAIVSAQLASE